MPRDRWEDASAYERFMGRWSRVLAHELVPRLAVRAGASWLEIGCGTGSLTSAICSLGQPASVVACDTASDYVAYCREHFDHPELSVMTVEPGRLPTRPGGFDAVVSSLVLNFLPSPLDAIAQMRECCAPGGCVAASVWDYSDGMEFLRIFWDTAVELDPGAEPLHEGRRFPLCRPEPLRAAFESADLNAIDITQLDVSTTFSTFDDFWAPFVDGPGPAPTYVSSLARTARQALADRLRQVLGPHTPIQLSARAWAVKGLRAAA